MPPNIFHLSPTIKLPKPRNLISTIPNLFLLSFSTTTTDNTNNNTRTNSLSLYLRRARAIDTVRLLLRRNGPTTPLLSSLTSDPFVTVQSIRCSPTPEAALSLFHSLPSQNKQTVHAIAKTLALARRTSDLRSLLAAVDSASFPTPILPPSSLDRLRWFSAASDLESSLQCFEVLRSSGRRGHACTEAFNLVMKVCIDNGRDESSVEMFERMVEEGSLPNSRTYTVMIEHLVKLGRLEDAVKVFDRLPLMRIRRTSKQYNVLADGFLSKGSFVDVKKLIDEMRCDGMLPPRGIRDAMVKMRDAAYEVDEIGEFAEELRSDSRIGYVEESNLDDEEEEEEDGCCSGGDGSERIKLKPWMDPSALASALGDWDTRDVKELERVGFVWTTRLVCKLLRGFKKAETAWKFFTWVTHQSGGFTHDRYTVSRMIAILARNGHEELVEKLICKVKTEKILLPFSTVRLVIDFFGLSKRPEAATMIFKDVNSICGHISNANHALLCSSLLRTLVKCKRGSEIKDILEEMILNNIFPDLQTFSGLMQFSATVGDLEGVHKLFGIVRQCGIEPDAYMYQVLIRAYINNERPALALRAFEDMMNARLLPDAKTKSLLVRSLWDEGKRREVAYVEERCEESGGRLPVGLPGHAWTVSSSDLMWVLEVYRKGLASSKHTMSELAQSF